MKDQNYYRAEAVAMRRIIADRGYPLALGWEPPELDEKDRALDLRGLAEAEARRLGRPSPSKGLAEPRKAAPRGEGPGRRAEYKNLSLSELQDRERERNQRRHQKDKARAIAEAEAPAPKASAKPAKPAPARRELKPLSDADKARAIAEIAQRAAAEPEGKKPRFTPEQAERRRAGEKLRRAKRRAEMENDPEKLAAFQAKRRESDRAARLRNGAIPRPETQKN